MTALEKPSRGAIEHFQQSRAESLQPILKRAAVVAKTMIPVLIEGETGTGKEVLATFLHKLSGREGNFIPVNCAAIPAELAEAEFFGHRKGAFTGATESREGSFRAADGGTLFLDEIGDLPLTLQVKLLRALQEKKVTPVGSDKEIPVNVRVIAASNRNLADMVAKGAFREDLYYRLNVVSLGMPPLRDRPEDIPALATYFLDKHVRDNDFPDLALPSETMVLLQQHKWPGNIRQMSNAIASAAINAISNERTEIIPSDIPVASGRVSLPEAKNASDSQAHLMTARTAARSAFAPAIIDRKLLPEAELDMLVLDRPSAQLIFNAACNIMSNLSLRSFTATALRRAPLKISLEEIAGEQNVSVRAVKESLHAARQALFKYMVANHPDLTNSPITRKRNYQTSDESKVLYPYFNSERLAQLEPQHYETLQIASLLLNNRAYHQAGWALLQPRRGIQKAFNDEVALNSTIEFRTFLKAFQEFEQRAHLVMAHDEAILSVSQRTASPQ